MKYENILHFMFPSCCCRPRVIAPVVRQIHSRIFAACLLFIFIASLLSPLTTDKITDMTTHNRDYYRKLSFLSQWYPVIKLFLFYFFLVVNSEQRICVSIHVKKQVTPCQRLLLQWLFEINHKAVTDWVLGQLNDA